MRKHAEGAALADRFWSYVDKRGPDECWIWTGTKTPASHCRGAGMGNLYGKFSFIPEGSQKRKSVGAHRFSFYLHYGRWPAEVLHTCDIKSCVRPEHLKEGPHSENMREASLRGLLRKSLTDDQVLAIRASSLRVCDLAVAYGVHHSAISRIRARKRRTFI